MPRTDWLVGSGDLADPEVLEAGCDEGFKR